MRVSQHTAQAFQPPEIGPGSLQRNQWAAGNNPTIAVRAERKLTHF
jgi:hypothetical protein